VDFLAGLSVSIAFILGCAASRVVVPSAQAQYAGPRWQYFCLEAQRADTGGAAVWCFKRPLK
jgi:hypothetical protein